MWRIGDSSRFLKRLFIAYAGRILYLTIVKLAEAWVPCLATSLNFGCAARRYWPQAKYHLYSRSHFDGPALRLIAIGKSPTSIVDCWYV